MTNICYADTDLLTPENALKKILSHLHAIKGYEICSLKNALGRVLTDFIYSPINIPPERNSAMDGYAIISSDIKPNQLFNLSQVGTSWAGKPFKGTLTTGQCVRIFTGAVVPENTDTVIIQERVTVKNKHIYFPNNCQPFEHVRQAGNDIKQNKCLLTAGKKLKPVDLGLLASAGIHSVKVTPKLRLAYFSTGDELVTIGRLLQSGKIYDSNRYLLHGLLADIGIDAVDMGVIADDETALELALNSAAKNYDVIITTGGASVGDADYIKQILDKIGQVNFWKLAMKPGKPVAFGHIGNCIFFGLPGNPVSVSVTFDKLVKPALLKLMGMKAVKPLRIKAKVACEIKKSAGREEYQRGILTQQSTGTFIVTSAGKQDSNIITSMSQANCYIVLPANYTTVKIGEEILVEPFDSFI